MGFDSVLVANRGEIAVRVIRACHESALRVVAVHTAADRDLPYLEPGPYSYSADVAVEIASYLDPEEILRAARETGAEAIHPGYGFLSENAAFARSVTEAGLVWIGPTPEAMEAMARKDRAREIAERAGVPVTPRYLPDEVPSDAYPVLVKAAAGGGGKGMHVVRRAEDLHEALETAAREARSAFGDDTLLIEKYVERGRHVEVQVFGDTHGTVVHLGTRDCSVQRRHQKVVEEAPAPDLDDALRDQLHDSAVSLAEAVGYTSAGTVEFLVAGEPGSQVAYFLEMNTRLQVEHPVTEEVTGVDLVDWQFRVAAGEPLPEWDGAVEGHAIEVRVYAEDPYAGFLPQAGTIVDLGWPDNARVETAFYQGQKVGTGFDPMLAKVVILRDDRRSAIRALLRELDDAYVWGVRTNLGFLRRLIALPEFAAGEIHTGWLDSPAAAAFLTRPEVPALVGRDAAARWTGRYRRPGPWGVGDGWRAGGAPVAPRITFVVDGEHEMTFEAAGSAAVFSNAENGRGVWATHQGETWRFDIPDAFADHGPEAGDGTLLAPMPGTVLAVDVAEGDHVEEGQRLGVLEAMKMEVALKAPFSGVVALVGAAVGDLVQLKQPLFTVSTDHSLRSLLDQRGTDG